MKEKRIHTARTVSHFTHFQKAVKLTFTFYRTFFIAGIAISLSLMIVFYTHGLSPFIVLFWTKIISLLLIYLYVNKTRSHEYHYYNNLGLRKIQLWIGSLLIDLSIFFLLLFITLNIR